MEQPSTRTNQRTPHRSAPLPRPACGGPAAAPGRPSARRRPPARTAAAHESAAVYRARPPRAMSPALAVLHRLRWLMRMPAARLTGLGCGVLALLLTLAAGAADHLLPSGLPTVYGGVFLFAATVCALWVRPVELLAAPVAMPITFLLGLAPVTGGTDLTDRLLSLLSSLSLNADWLYAGTLLACTIVAVRKLLLMAERAALRAAGLQDPAGRRPATPDPEDGQD